MNARTALNALAAITLSLWASLSLAGVDTDTDANDVTLAGHDVVAYFTVNKAVPGKADITAVHNGAIYRFSSAEHRDMFRADPEKYAPMYGGYCAFGMTFGKKFAVDGKAFEVVDGKLYVNKNIDVYKAWKEDVPKHIVEADAAWPGVKLTPPAEL
jgi:YHS domain-containing protein